MTASFPTNSQTWRYLIQLPATALILAFVPGNVGKLIAMLILWILSFKAISRAELIFVSLVCAFFTAMNAVSLQHGIFAFKHPDILGMPVYELLMWGFYVLHTMRVLGTEAPQPRLGIMAPLTLAFSLAFGVISDGQTLLLVTSMLLIIGIACFHSKGDLAYTSYFVFMGAVFEYTGVHSGQWGYPGAPVGGVPLWFITLWGFVGLALHRLVLPILTKFGVARFAQNQP